jgi:esterase/lipase superfamily enzyme
MSGYARTFFAIVALLASLALPLPSAADAASGVPAVALFGLPAPVYVLCPASAQVRTACLPAGHPTGAAALRALRDAALQPKVERVVVFLPGYRTKFQNGLAAAVHIQSVLGERFLVVYADWGSHGSTAGYREDGMEARRQTPALANLLQDLHAALPGRPIDVFAHSMGARLAAGAMATVKEPANGKTIVAETVLAAPDLDLRDYEHAILRKPEPFGRVTVYASRHDRALLLSSIIHFHKRVGQLAIWRRTIADTVVVDASAADPGPQGHGYAIHDVPVILDIGAVFLDAPIPHPDWSRTSPVAVMWTLLPGRVPEKL